MRQIASNKNHSIKLDQLCVGLYVHLDVGWMDHPFAFSNFKIDNVEQISKIKSIGIKAVRYDPMRSDVKPLALATVLETQAEVPVEAAPVDKVPTISIETPNDEANEPKTFKEKRLIELHQAIDENEKKFVAASETAKTCTENFLTEPETCVEQGNELVQDLVSVALTEGDVAIHAINGHQSEAEYQHAMNVMVLSLMMSKTLDLTKEDAKTLGVAALFHDIGKLKLTDEVRQAKAPLNHEDRIALESHCALGAKLALDAGLSEDVANIIMQHHELMDGSGYPKQFVADKIVPLARLIGLVSCYDNLCNPFKTETAKTPYEALAFLFANQRTKYDENILKRMIKTMGIYPPGSIVQLSSGVYANVVSGNTNEPLRPFVMLHETNLHNNEPTIIDLREEPNMHISICLRPNQLPADVLAYFKPSKRVNFFLNKELPSHTQNNV